MTFSYDAGTSTPNLAGLVEIGTIRINDGTFELVAAEGLLLGSPEIRSDALPLPAAHGAWPTTPWYGPRDITLEGNIRTPLVEDLWGAIDLLKQTFNLADQGLKTLTVNTAGWTAARQIGVSMRTFNVISPSNFDDHTVGRRAFSVELVAPDPRLYEVTATSTTVTSSTTVPNAGTMPAPFVVRFNGPQTNPLIDGPGPALSNRVRCLATIASGHYIEVNTFDPTTGTMTAVDDTGANVMSEVSNATARVIEPGGSAWTKSNESGSGSTVMTTRGAWA